MKTMWGWLGALAGVGLVVVAGGCESDDTPCNDAKAHLCAKIQDMNCMTEFMDNAVNRIRTECGTEAGDAFVSAAKSACQGGNLASVCR